MEATQLDSRCSCEFYRCRHTPIHPGAGATVSGTFASGKRIAGRLVVLCSGGTVGGVTFSDADEFCVLVGGHIPQAAGALDVVAGDRRAFNWPRRPDLPSGTRC